MLADTSKGQGELIAIGCGLRFQRGGDRQREFLCRLLPQMLAWRGNAHAAPSRRPKNGSCYGGRVDSFHVRMRTQRERFGKLKRCERFRIFRVGGASAGTTLVRQLPPAGPTRPPAFLNRDLS